MPPKATDREETGGWHEYRLLLIHEIDRLNDGYKECVDKLNDQDRELTAIKARAATLGAVVALIVSSAVAIVSAILGRG